MAKGAPEPEEMRQRVYDTVRRYPGIHLRGIERELSTSAALAQYHLRSLAEEGLVEHHEQGGYARYYPTARGKSARVTTRDVPLVGLLREEVPLHIVLLLLDRGALTHTELVRELGIAKSTVSYHLAKLAEAGIVEREPGAPALRLADAERIDRLIRAYRPTPSLIDAFADLWEDLYG
ncbi:MAG TPA: ArsR family transcriptional regulator [Candidatus Thermoplasmatota archaeon]|nr:ArsR family transcriptional regulator [Candidatus Thermoplasmatota archaeon]